MEHIWAPWRMEYIQAKKPEGCILCEVYQQNKDQANYILYRGELNYVILNSYPYNPGHLMIVPFRHVASPEELTAEELNEHGDIIKRYIGILRRILGPAGFNIGMNLGKVAGAGIAEHCHSHIVPRWQGDTNYMPVVSSTRVVPEALAVTYQKLQGEF